MDAPAPPQLSAPSTWASSLMTPLSGSGAMEEIAPGVARLVQPIVNAYFIGVALRNRSIRRVTGHGRFYEERADLAGHSSMGRTSAVPRRAPGMRAATATASSRLATSMRK